MSFASLLRSFGLKRYVASGLAALIEVLRLVPGSEVVVAVLVKVNAALGFAAVGHASIAGTISTAKLAAASSALSLLIAIVPFVPALHAVAPLLGKIAALLGAAALGAKATSI